MGDDTPTSLAIVDLRRDELARLEPLWLALHAHHAETTPALAGAPVRAPAESWVRRRAKYERWLEDAASFALLARREERPVGYAFVTVGPGHATWRSSERMAELQTLSVLPGERGRGVGTALLDAVEERLRSAGVDDLQVTAALTNADSHRLYERRGYTRAFVTFYGSVPRPTRT